VNERNRRSIHSGSGDDDVVWTLGRSHLTSDDRRAAASQVASFLETGSSPADVVERLAAHGLVPLAYRHLIAAGDAGLPDALARELTGEFRRHALSRLRYTRRLRELLTVLDTAGVEAVPYKGPGLAIQLFGNYAMRQFGDLDILVRPSDAERAMQALLAAGLTRHRKTAPAWDRYLQRVRHSYELRDAGENVVVELHWALADRFLGMNVDVAWLFEAPGRIDLLGRPTAVMSGERLLLALCLHGTKHLWERAVWLAEVAELLRQPTIDWDSAFRHADRGGLGRALRACLILARTRLDSSPPAPWSDRLDDDRAAARLAAMLSERKGGAPDRLEGRFRLGYQAQASFMRRARFCWHVATDLSDRDARGRPRPPALPIIQGLARTIRLARALLMERRRRLTS
jgi:hypothetical protein